MIEGEKFDLEELNYLINESNELAEIFGAIVNKTGKKR